MFQRAMRSFGRVLPAGAAVLLTALLVAPSALAKDETIGYTTTAPLSGGLASCNVGQACTVYASGGYEPKTPVTGRVTSFTLTHAINQGAGQTATLLVVNDDSGLQVTAESAPVPLSTTYGTETFDLSSNPLPISRGQMLALTITPGDSTQTADNVAPESVDWYGRGVWECSSAPAVGDQISGCNQVGSPDLDSNMLALSAYVVDNQLPPSIDSYGPPDVAATSATLHALVNPNGQDTLGWFIYGTDPSNLSQESAYSQDLGAGTADVPLDVSIGHLTPNTTYYYEALATNYDASNDSGDQSAATAVQSFKTPAAPAPAVTAGVPSAIGEKSVVLNGTVNPEGNDSTWYFQYGTTAGYGSQSTGGTVSGSSAATPVSDQLSNLQPDTTYHYQLLATNAAGTNTTTDGTFTTAKGTAPVLDSYTATGNGSNDPTVQVLSFAIDGDGYTTTYQVNWGTTTSYGHSSPVENSASAAGTANSDSYTLTGLTPQTTYHYQVVATNRWGTTTGTDQTFTTPAAPKPAVSQFLTTYAGQTSAKGTFHVNDEGYPTTVTVDYGPTTSYGSNSGTASASGSNAVIAFTMDNLAPGTVYHWRAAATNKWGTSYGPDETFTTASPAPAPSGSAPALSGYGLTYVGAGSVAGVFHVNDQGYPTTVTVDYGPTTSYGSSSGTAGASGSDAVIAFTMDNLSPGSLYHWRVAATNEWGTTYGPDETVVTESPVQLASVLRLLGGSTGAPVVVFMVNKPVLSVGRFSCPPACGVTVTFTVPGSGHHRAQSLGAARFTVPKSKTANLIVRLSGAAVKKAVKARRLHVLANYRITDANGSVVTITRQLTLAARGRARR